VLDSAVGESDGVRSLDIAGTIGGLLTVEVRLGVVIGHGVGEGVGGDLVRVLLGLVSGGGLVSNGGGLVSWGWGIGWGGVDGVSNHWGVMHGVVDGGVDSVVDGGMDSVVDWGVDSVVDWGVMDSVGYRGDGVEGNDSSLASWHDPVGSNGGLDLSKTLGVVGLGHGGVSGSESLGLAESSDLAVGGGD